MDEPRCALCGGRDAPPHHEEAGCTYRRCARCGLVFLWPRPSAEDLERLYREEAGATFHHGAEIRAAYEKRLEARLRLAVVARALRAAPERSALEVGCGAGYLLDELRRRGWRVAGTEVAPAYVRFARERLRLRVDRERPREKFGAVLLFNVLSHVPDPEAEFARCREGLRPGGVLALETGNAAEVPPSRVGPFGAPEHVWHFSEPTLRALLERAGFRDVRVRRFNVEWQRGALRRLGALRRGPAGPAAAPGSPSSAPAPRERWARRLAAWGLLGLRFGAGRLGADRNHFCTMFVTARRDG